MAVISDFSESEVKQRWARVQDVMKSKGWGTLLIVDEQSVGPGCGVRYLAGMSHTNPPIPGYMVLGESGAPLIVMNEGMGGSAVNLTELYSYAGIVSQSGRGGDFSLTLADALSRVGYKGGPLAVDGLNLLRHVQALGLQKQFGDITFVNANRTVEKTRIVRSEAETLNYRRSAELTYNAMEVFMRVIRPGVTEDLAVEEACHSTVIQGGEENMLVHGTGTPWVWGRGVRGEARTFQEGDIVAVELNARWHGYYSQVGRAWGLGKLAPEKQAIIDAVRAATDKMVSYTRPGMVGKEIFHVGLKEIRARGFDFSDVRYGHGIGLTIGEGFDIADWDGNVTDGPCNTPIPVGAHGNFHPFIIIPGPNGRGVYSSLWADPWIMGEHGLEFLIPENSRAQVW